MEFDYHIFEITSISNEKPWILMEILGILNQKFGNTRYLERNNQYFEKDVKSWVFSRLYVCPLALASVLQIDSDLDYPWQISNSGFHRYTPIPINRILMIAANITLRQLKM